MGSVVDAYIEVISGLRGEIYILRTELEEASAAEEGAHMIIATERAEVAQLRRRVAELEVRVANAGAVKVKPLVWEWSETIRGYIADCILTRNIFSVYESNGKWMAGSQLSRNSGYPSNKAAMAAMDAEHTAIVLSSIQPDTDRLLALTAAAYEAAHDAVHYECWTDGDGGRATDVLLAEQNTTSLALRAIRALTHSDATAALARIEAAAEARGRVKGMREAAGIANECGREVDAQDGSYIRHHPLRGPVFKEAILARAAEIEKDAK